MARFQGLAGEYERPENPQPVGQKADQEIPLRTLAGAKDLAVSPQCLLIKVTKYTSLLSQWIPLFQRDSEIFYQS
jgi:hypothetical protein